MRLLKFFWIWGRRLPGRFSLSFVVLLALYLLLLTGLVRMGLTAEIGSLLSQALDWLGLPQSLQNLDIVQMVWSALVTVVLLLAGVLIAYNLSVPLYRRIRNKPLIIAHAAVTSNPGGGTRLERFKRIGIILAGGGAKGAYQAGAMKAIHAFLEENNALHKVVMIAGTSIGSWNAMFWLADLVKPPAPGQPGAHEEWWRNISLGRLVEFDYYLPLAGNHFVRSDPWQEMFRGMFVDPPAVRERLARLVDPAQEAPMHFYFTRSNVERGLLEFSTNWPGLAELKRHNWRTANAADMEFAVRRDQYEVILDTDPLKALQRMKTAVFASMDLPPLFPQVMIKTDMEEWFEDGGVVDNLPVWFGSQLEHCDLLFVLPLNASFAESRNKNSVTKRLFRVMDVRQGVIERNAFKLAYLYNEIADLRRQLDGRSFDNRSLLAARALMRTHEPLSIFAICPGQPLAIGTAEFWKPAEAARAFELMYAETKYELEEKFEEDTNPNCIRMTVVSPLGERSYFEDF